MTTATPVNIYHNHPPFISLWVSLVITLFGESEFATRLSVMLPTLVLCSAVFHIASRLFDRTIGLVALIFFVTSPVIAFYGQMVAHEEFILLFFAFAIMAYLSLQQDVSTNQLVLLAVFSGLTVFAGWGGYLCIIALGLHSLLFRRNIYIWLALFLGVLTATIAWMLPASLQYDFLETLYSRFLLRSGQTFVPWNSPLDYWVTMIWARIRPLYSEALLLITAFGSIGLLIKSSKNLASQRGYQLFAVFLLLPHLLYLIVLRESAFRHDYTVYYLSIAAALLGAYFIVTATRKIQHLENSSLQRLVMIGIVFLVLAHAASSIRWIRIFYSRSDDFPVVAGRYIRENATNDTTVYANVGWWPATWYYAEHNIKGLEQFDPDAQTGSIIVMDCLRGTNANASDADLVTDAWMCTITHIP